MPRIPGLRSVFRLATRRPPVHDDVDVELAFHFAMAEAELVRRGLSPEAAHTEARRRFGDVDARRAELRAIDGTRERRRIWRERMESIAHDVRHAVRSLRRQPSFALGVILTFVLGIGANATMFGLVDRLLLRPPAYVVDPSAVTRLYVTATSVLDHKPFTAEVSDYPTFRALHAQSHTLSRVAAFMTQDMTLGRGAEARRVAATLATGDYFALVGARPLLGRFLGPDDDREGMKTAVLGYALWRSAFGGDSSVVGRVVQMQKSTYRIVGVAPRGFGGADIARTDVWLPLRAAAEESWLGSAGSLDEMRGYWLSIVARFRPGVDPQRAEAEVTRIVRGAQDDSIVRPTMHATLGSLVLARGPTAPSEAKVARWLAGVAGLVLLIACANIANMLLARGVRAERETTVRVALGVARRRLVWQQLLEVLLLATVGGALALFVAHVAGRGAQALLLPNVAWDGSPVDGRVLISTAVIVLAAALIAGVGPALRASRPSLATALRASGRGMVGGSSRLRTTLLVTQAALAALLLVGAGLFVRSLRNALDTDLGVDPTHALVASIDLPGAGWRQARADDFEARALERLRAVPGVLNAAAGTSFPFGGAMGMSVTVPGRDSLPKLPTGGPYGTYATPGYFAALGGAVRRGRDFTDADRAGAPPVVIVNETLARLYWPNDDAIGQCVRLGNEKAGCHRVVGVVANMRRSALREDPQLSIYMPIAQEALDAKGIAEERPFIVRTAGDAEAVAGSVRSALQSLAPDLPFVDVRPLATRLDRQLRPWRLGATLFGVFGAIALVLAGVGLYGVLAYDVAQRRSELGVRLALGARGRDVLRYVLARGARVALVGIALGLIVAIATAPLLGDLLFGVSPRDPLTLGGVALALTVVAVVAAVGPGWRAARVDPRTALHSD